MHITHTRITHQTHTHKHTRPYNCERLETTHPTTHDPHRQSHNAWQTRIQHKQRTHTHTRTNMMTLIVTVVITNNIGTIAVISCGIVMPTAMIHVADKAGRAIQGNSARIGGASGDPEQPYTQF